MDDAELLYAYVENKSETAFAEFVGRRIGFVYATALRQVMGDAQMAGDVTQTVFRLVAQKAPALAAHKCLAGWLYTATGNVAFRFRRDALRRRKREQEAIFMSELHRVNGNDGIAGNEKDAEVAAMRTALDAALGALREGERQAVLLRYFEGKTFTEIGVKLKMSGEAARKRVIRAVEKMRGTFAKRGVTSSAAALGALMTAEAAQGAPAGLAASVSVAATTGAGAVTAATAAGAGASTSAFFVFMSSAKITTIAIMALLIAAGGFYYGEQSKHAAADTLDQALKENIRLTSQLRESEKQNAAAAASTPSASAAQHDPVAAGEAFLTDHPEIKEKMSVWVNTLGARFAFRIAHEMNLSPGQSARLAELMNGRSSRLIHNTPGYGAVELRSGNWQSYSKRNEAIRDLLGEVNYEKFNELTALDNIGADYNINGLGVASFSNDVSLASALYFTDVPLTSEQARSLEKIAGDLKKNHPGITDPQAHWSAFMEQAGSILSPGQMRAFMAVGDRYVWKQTSEKWINDYDEARTVTTATRP